MILCPSLKVHIHIHINSHITRAIHVNHVIIMVNSVYWLHCKCIFYTIIIKLCHYHEEFCQHSSEMENKTHFMPVKDIKESTNCDECEEESGDLENSKEITYDR